MSYNYSNKTLFGINSDAERYSWTACNLLIITASFIGDTTILVGSIKYKAFQLHKIIVTIIQHIAVCDLLLSAMILQRTVSLAVGASKEELGAGLCYLKAYLGGYTMTASVFLICAMTLSKYLLLKYPLRTGPLTRKHAHQLCALMWTVSLYFPVTFLLTDKHDVSFDYRQYDCAYNFSSHAWKWLKPVSSLLLGIIPNVTIIVTTVLLLNEARKVARGERLRWQGIMTVVLTAVVYSVSIIPLTVYYLAEPYVEKKPGDPSEFYTDYFRIASAFLNINVMANFYIYSLTVTSFRKFLKSKVRLMFPCCFKGSAQQGRFSGDRVPDIRAVNRAPRVRPVATRTG